MYHRNSIVVVISITILYFNQYNAYEILSKDFHTRLPSSQLYSSPRDQANYSHYRRLDQNDNYTPQQPQVALNSIQKSDKYQGWKPIISSRSLPVTKHHHKSSTPAAEKYTHVATESSLVSDANRKPYQATKQMDFPAHQSFGETTVKPSKTFKNKIIKEDDIMWMHYGPVDEDDRLKEKLLFSPEENIENSVNYEKVDSKKQYHSQYRVKQPTQQIPKNIYEIIDQSRPVFKPIAESKDDVSSWKGANFADKMQATETRSLIEATASDKYPSLDLYDRTYNELHTKNQVESKEEPHRNEIYENIDNELVVKVNSSYLSRLTDDKTWNQNEKRYYTQTNIKNSPTPVRSTTETIYENKPDTWLLSYFVEQNSSEKGGGNKFLGKPIVIAEESEPLPYLTTEYYRRLFDSFGREDRSFDRISSDDAGHESKFFNQTNTKHQPTNTTANNQTNSVFDTFENCTSNQTHCKKTSKDRNQQLSHKPYRKHHFNSFKFMGIDMRNLVPKTLRTNIYLIKKLLTECYTEPQVEDPSPVFCLKRITTKVLDNAIDSEIIKLTDSVSLIKENVTSIVEQESSRSSFTNIDWLSNVVEKMARLFSTHSLRVQLVNSQEDHKYQIEGRRRHYFRRVFPVIAGVYLTITAVLIPIVFQFMAMMGGKSFVISKIALIFAVLSSVSKFLNGGEQSHPHHHHHAPPPSYHPPMPPPHETPSYYEHSHPQQWKKSDKRFKRVPINYSYYTVE